MSDLVAHLVAERGDFLLDIELECRPGEVVALLGRNGAGKSTALAALAGLLPLTGGRIAVGDAILDDPGSDRFLDASHRSIGVVFQSYLLFPHLSVLANVAFGLRARGRSRGDSQRIALDWLRRVGLEDRAKARPSALSGGMAQRVALARALAPEPELLLLDEPLAALDAEIRDSVRSELAIRLREHTGCAVLVTHDPVDAEVLADRILVLDHGRIVQSGTVDELRRDPISAYVAALFPAE
ncbi:ATP-binding cassette domain-containing protein [Naasia lichenicola]|uniref:ABC transporter ATP-binding protein n=1 Tax=Naasia lichenicola TaxID=2565933 RepID=A0A4S4FNH3_9MICO|nr:ABC transporter ATP-binding protein [Naasia lichenicola]THG31791.1 ABC transporter ATP-binding protein [Naasia lichenicola]